MYQAKAVNVVPGQKIGSCTFLEQIPKPETHHWARYAPKGMFLCGCGNKFIARISGVIHSKGASCGCKKTTHGMCRTPEHAAWTGMRRRCSLTTDQQYHIYGARGIKVCDRWKDSFANFFEDMGPRPSPKHSLDRIDVDGDYCPENCRWATQKEQMRNVTYNRKIEYDGVTRCLAEWSELTGISASLISIRIKRLGWTAEKALTTPVRSHSHQNRLGH